MAGFGASSLERKCLTKSYRNGWMTVRRFEVLFVSILKTVAGDRVQWFRAEAEMQRWREEWEFKQADFMRTISTFQRMSSVWGELGTVSSAPGSIAYSKKQSAMYQEMERHAKELFSKAGYSHLTDGKILADYICEERAKEEYVIAELSITEVRAYTPLQ